MIRYLIGIIILSLAACSLIQPRFHETAAIDNLKVHVVASPYQFPKGCASWLNDGCACSPPDCPGYEIWMLGTIDALGRVDFGYWITGHELGHILNWKYPEKFCDPHGGYITEEQK